MKLQFFTCCLLSNDRARNKGADFHKPCTKYVSKKIYAQRWSKFYLNLKFSLLYKKITPTDNNKKKRRKKKKLLTMTQNKNKLFIQNRETSDITHIVNLKR